MVEARDSDPFVAQAMRRHCTSLVAALVAALLATALAAAPTGAQRSDSIPRELAEALLGGFGRVGATSLRVGTASEGFPSSLIPADARVLGSLTRMTQSTTVLVLPQPEGEVRRVMQDRLAASGFALFRSPEPPRRGFVSSAMEGYATAGQYCRGDEGIMLTAMRREPGGTMVWLQHVSERVGGGWCRTREQLARGPSLYDNLPVPALTPPDGFRSEQSGSGGGGDTWSLTARLFGNGSSESVVRHYTEQLVADGWVAMERTQGNDAALQLLRREKDGQLEWSAVLLAVSPARGQGPMDVTLNLRKY